MSKDWKSTKDYLHLRPYLLINIDHKKIFQLIDKYNLIDPTFMNLFYDYDISINMEGLTPKYFGYRKAWYSLFYDNRKNVMKTIDYILKIGDCTYTASFRALYYMVIFKRN